MAMAPHLHNKDIPASLLKDIPEDLRTDTSMRLELKRCFLYLTDVRSGNHSRGMVDTHPSSHHRNRAMVEDMV